MQGIFVTATDTEVGKTFVAGLLVRALRSRGAGAAYIKAIASGCRLQDGNWRVEDLEWVEQFTGLTMPVERHCPVCFSYSLAPLAAARLEGRSVDIAAIKRACAALGRQFPVLVVEGIGGVMVPLQERYLVLDLMVDLGLPVLVVARPSLGTINHTLLTLAALQSRGLSIVGFLTNGERNEGDPAVITSPDIISEISGVAYFGHVPFFNPGDETPDAFLAERVPFLEDLLGAIQERNGRPAPSSCG